MFDYLNSHSKKVTIAFAFTVLSIFVSIAALVISILGHKVLFLYLGNINLIHFLCVWICQTKEEYKEAELQHDDKHSISRKRIVDILATIIMFSVLLGVVYFFFGVIGFAWIGIIWGLGYIPQTYRIISDIKNRNL